jgi:diamine N-acetyltransferase
LIIISLLFFITRILQQMAILPPAINLPANMIIQTKNKREVLLSVLSTNDLDALLYYLDHLSNETKKRFGPHPFDRAAVINFYKDPESHKGFVAFDTATGAIIAYAIIKTGYLHHDSQRLQSYGLSLSNLTDCTYAPSVADEWQGLGIGNSLFHFILSVLKPLAFERIILWGGVQADNTNALNYYTKNSFTILGQFDYNGLNYDMVYDITK